MDGSRIFFIAASGTGERGLWAVPAGGGDPTQLVRFDEPSLFLGPMNALTVGAEYFYVTLAEYESDIWVMDLEW